MKHILKYIFIIFIFISPLFSQNTQIEKDYQVLLKNVNNNFGYCLSSYQNELLKNKAEELIRENNFHSIIIKDLELDDYHNFIKVNDEIFYNRSDKKIKQDKSLVELKKEIFYNKQKVGVLFIYIKKEIKKANINLTQKEKLWIKQNPVIKLAIMSYWPNNKNGSSLHNGVIKLINKYANTNIIPISFDIWSEGYSKASVGNELNGIMGLSYSKEREKNHFFYSPSYDFTPAYLITRKNEKTIKSFEDIKYKTVYIKKDSITQKIIKHKSPSTKIIPNKTVQEMLKKLNNHEQADAILSYFVDKSEVERYNLKIIDKIYDKYGEVSIGINHKYPELASIIKKALNAIPKSELDNLRDQNGITLTTAEKKWLSQKTTIEYVYDPNWKPFEWSNELKEHQGIIADLIKIIQHKSDIEFKSVYSKTWNDAIKKVKSKQAHMISAVGETAERKRYLNFTSSNLYSIPYVFVSKRGTDYVNGFEDLQKKKVAVAQNYTIHNILTKYKPDIKPVLVQNNQEGLNKVNNGEVDVMLLNVATAKYYINILGYDSLKISYKTRFNLDLKIALRKDTPQEVLSIIDKTIQSISKKEFDDILYKWTEVVVRDKTDWLFISQIIGAVSFLLLIMYLNNRKLKSLVKEKTKDIQEQHENMQDQKEELENLVNSFDKNVIFTKTNLKGIITHASEAFCEISGYTKEELIGQPHNIVRHPDTPKHVFKKLWESLKQEKTIILEIKNIRKDGSYYWIEGKFEPDYDKDGTLIGYRAVRQEITSKKEVQKLTLTLENKVRQRTNELDRAKQQIEKILENILLPVLITSKKNRQIVYANKFAEIQYDTKLEDMIGSSIDKLYTVKDQNHGIIQELQKSGMVDNMEQRFKTHTGKEFTALLSVTPIVYEGDDAYIGMVTDITKQKQIEQEIRQIHKQTRDSIEYASIIQHSLIPDRSIFENYFSDHLSIWEPKDIVGGDVYLVEAINDDEIIVMVIDCTGHGVPGAFVTMLVKAIERQVIAIINNNDFIEISPAWILSYFNQTIKTLLNQNSNHAKSNAGFDGGILYYNKQDKVIKFAGANTPLFYIDENNNLFTIKSDRHSIGYKNSDINYIFKDHTIDVKDGMKFYMTTDGYIDQNGGTKGFPFGKKRFEKIINEHSNEEFFTQKTILKNELKKYQNKEDRNDDITVVGVKI